jgi:hypothetical protein
MKRVIKLTENDLSRIVKRILSEGDPGDGKPDSFPEFEGRDDIYADNPNVEKDNKDEDIIQQVTEYWYNRKSKRGLYEEVTQNIENLKTCYTNAKIPFPKDCEKELGSKCKDKIKFNATDLVKKSNNAQGDSKVLGFWKCINKIDKNILQGMG